MFSRRELQLLVFVAFLGCILGCSADMKLRFEVPMKLSKGNRVYTSQRAKNDTSTVFVVFSMKPYNGMLSGNTLLSYTSEGAPLASYDAGQLSINPEDHLLTFDSTGVTLAITALTGNMMVEVAAFDVITMKKKWSFGPSPSSTSPYFSVRGMVFVSPELATSCPNGTAGAVSFVICGWMNCKMYLVDVNSGVECASPVSLPMLNNIQTFPSPHALSVPILIDLPAQQADGTWSLNVTGFEAVSGKTLFSMPIINNTTTTEESFSSAGAVQGVAPQHDRFAYWYVDSAKDAWLVVAKIGSGSVTLRTKLPSQLSGADLASFAWTHNKAFGGGVLSVSVTSPTSSSVLLTFDSVHGSLIALQQLPHYAIAYEGLPVVSGGVWNFLLATEKKVNTLVAVPQGKQGASSSTPLPPISGQNIHVGPLYSFTFDNGTLGLATFEFDLAKSQGNLLVYNIV